MDAQPIENHGIIGDLHTAALVGIDGCIDFMCFPRFDSPSLFAALLDPAKGGRFQIAPVHAEVFRCRQLYLPDTNILLTRFLAPTAGLILFNGECCLFPRAETTSPCGCEPVCGSESRTATPLRSLSFVPERVWRSCWRR